jgi:hypothetical protein
MRRGPGPKNLMEKRKLARLVQEPLEIDCVEQASRDSFPASDPPGWLVMHPGPPDATDKAAPDAPSPSAAVRGRAGRRRRGVR